MTVDFLPALACVDRAEWQQALSRGDSHVVFLTPEWQQVWWDVYGRGKLLLIAVRTDNELVALAPLFADEGMVYFVGSGGSDYLDFVGDVSAPDVLEAILTAVREKVDGFVGFRFYLVPGRSRTGVLLGEAAKRLAFDFCDEGAIPAPVLHFDVPGALEAAINKKTVRQAERFFERNGGIELSEMRTSDEILPHLDEFFAQHIDRWQSTPFPSLFLQERHRHFYRRLICEATGAGWLRFTRLEWQDRAIAMHFGFCFGGSYVYYKPAFATDLARHSPGNVLLRRLLLSAVNEHAATFDFGIGDEAYKQRFATATPVVKTWGLYAPGCRPA